MLNNYLCRPALDMEGQRKLLEDGLMRLLDPCTTPETALQLFSSPENTRGINENAIIFLAYFRFMMTRLPDACVEGIWEDILNKAVMYTRFLHGPEVALVMLLKRPRMNTEDCAMWLKEALSAHEKCPNPYSRLKLFRIIRMIQCPLQDPDAASLNWEPVCAIFIHTINEIKPHHIYPSGNKKDNLFSVEDLTNIISKKETIKIISTNINAQICNNKEVFVDSKETRFISHCIQLIGVFAVLARSLSDTFPYYEREKIKCYAAFNDNIGNLVYCADSEPYKYRNPREWFRYVVSRPPFHHYAIQTIRILIANFINKEGMAVSEIPSLEYLRDVARDLGVCNKTCTLPRLLLYCQIHGSTLARQHTLLIPKLLLKNLSPLYKFVDNTEEDDNDQNVLSQGDSDYLHEASDSHEDSDSQENSDLHQDSDSHDHSDYSHSSSDY
ncbi:unnamed protein product [Meganyctiphanes norvegica]|uniref:SOCS box domain-containing protein n=1 Tax=Meganyctiphanes norvegica TaxID=48144 RepID=A0AAV2SR64_MEGNR